MGLGDDYGSLADTLARLTRSPRVQYLGNSLKGALSQAAGPFIGAGSKNGSPQGIGAFARHTGGTKGQGDMGAVLGSLAGSLTSQFNGESDPLMDLYQQLLSQLQAPVNQPTGIDTEDLMRQVQNAINPIYDQRAQQAEDRTGRYTKDVQGMYGALAEDYKKLAPQQIEQAAAAQDEIKQLYGQLRSNIEGNYSRVSSEQADLFQKLGIEDALPEVLGDQAPAETDALTAASENQAQQQQRYMDIGQADSTYYREGAPNAVMRGNEESTNLLNQLQDYLGQVDAERTSGIQTAYMDQLGQAQSSLAQQQQAAQSEAGRRQEMLWQMLQSQLQGQGQQQTQALTPDTFMSQLPANVQQGVAGAFTSLQRSPEAVYGKVEDPRNPVPGTYVETTPQWYMQQADAMLNRGEIDPTTYQALQMYLQIYFKQ